MRFPGFYLVFPKSIIWCPLFLPWANSAEALKPVFCSSGFHHRGFIGASQIFGEQTFKIGIILTSSKERGKGGKEVLCSCRDFKPAQEERWAPGRAFDTEAMPGGPGEGTGSSPLPRTLRDAPQLSGWCGSLSVWCCGHLLRPRMSFLLSGSFALGCEFAAPIRPLIQEPASFACVVLSCTHVALQR